MTKPAIVEEPSSSVDSEEKLSIWASILRDVKSSTKKAPATKSLIVLGDNESGRTTLVAKLQGNDDPKRGAGLEYHYIDVKDDDTDDTPKLGVWILDGDVACSAPLLKFALKSESVEHAVVILVGSMTHPWSLLNTLRKWTSLIEEHLDRLKLDPTRLQEMRDRLQRDFQHYVEPTDTSAAVKTPGRVPSSTSTVSLSTPVPDEQIVLPLPEGVLSKSLGVPVIVVITKCDAMSTLEKDNDYKDEQFDFMQYHLRKFCLEYGAALIYTSVKEKKNIEKLYKYLVHKCYDYPFVSPASIVERDAIFIPAGWDNPKKAQILLENLHRLKTTDQYADVFVKPISRRPLQRDNEVVMAEDDQEFLGRLQLTLNRAASPGRSEEPGTPAASRAPASSTAQTPLASSRPRAQAGGASAATNEGALANFFNGLLTRKSAAPGTPTGPATRRPTIVAQSPTTPSTKNLPQHPLTFAVTPPPGRSRTPTSQKPFPHSNNADSSPKVLSPVVEKRAVDLAESVHEPAMVSNTVNGENHLSQRSSSPALTADEQPTPATSFVPEEKLESNLDQDRTENGSNHSLITEAALSSALPAAIIKSESRENLPTTTNTDDQDRPRSRSPSPALKTGPAEERSRPTSPVAEQKFDETSNDLQNNAERDGQSPSPISEANKQRSRSPSLNAEQGQERSRSASPVNEQRLEESAQDQSNGEEQPGRSGSPINEANKQRSRSPSLHAEQREDRSRSPSPVDRQKSLRSRSPSISAEPVSATSQPTSPTTENKSEEITNDLTTIDGDHNRSHSPSIGDSRPSSPTVKQNLDESPDQLTNNDEEHHRSASPSFGTEQERSRPGSPKAEEEQFRSASPTNEERSQHPPSPLPEPNVGENEEIHDRSASPVDQQTRSRSPSPSLPAKEQVEGALLASPIQPEAPTSGSAKMEDERERSRSPSPSAAANVLRSRSPSPVNQEKTQRSRSPSPSTEANVQRSRSPSLNNEQEQERSRPSSPTVEPKSEETPVVLTDTEDEKKRSRSPSPANEQRQSRTGSVSPVDQANTRTSRSPSLNNEGEHNRSVFPIEQEKPLRSRSPSPVNQEKTKRSRSPSPSTETNAQRSRSPSLSAGQEEERSRPSSPTAEPKFEEIPIALIDTGDENKRSRSPSPANEQRQSRTGSVSSTDQEKRRTSRSPSLNAGAENNRSASPIEQEKPLSSRSPSPVNQEKAQRSRSPSLSTEANVQSSRSPSLTTEHEQERSRPPSSITEPKSDDENKRSRSPSPANEQRQSRTGSVSPADQTKSRTSRSPSLNAEEENNRSPSPAAVNNAQRSRSPSLNTEQEKERSRSPSPANKQKHSRTGSVSPVDQDDPRKSRSPSVHIEDKIEEAIHDNPNIEENRNRPASPDEQGKPLRSRSPSPVIQESTGRSPSPSPSANTAKANELSRPVSPVTEPKLEATTNDVVNIEDEQIRSASPIGQEKPMRSRSPSPVNQQRQSRSRSTSPVDQKKLRTSRSPSLNTENKAEETTHESTNIEEKRDRSPSPVNTEQTQKHTRPVSPTMVQKPEDHLDLLANAAEELDQPESPIHQETAQRSRSPSPNTEGISHEVIHKGEEHVERKPSIPAVSPLKDNQSMEKKQSPVNDPIPEPQAQQQPSHTLTNNSPAPPRRVLSGQPASFDQSHSSSASAGRRPSLTRSRSQTAVTRPTTLPFSPNNHDLDGLYMSSELNDDEDEIAAEQNDHHRKSAPSTVSVEHSRSSLFDQPSPINPLEISKRLSIVEKSRLEGIPGDIRMVMDRHADAASVEPAPGNDVSK